MFALHCTHCFRVGSHIFAVAGQSVDVTQPTQAPVAVSQIVPRAHGAPPSTAHAAWHVRLPG